VSSPNDPVHPGDGPGDGNGVSGNGGPPDHGDVPPWERGSSRARPTQRMTEHPPRTDGGRGGTTNGPSPVDARINRFMSGGSVSPARDSVPPRETASPLPPRETASPLPPRDTAAPPRDVPPRESTPPLRDSESVRPEVYASEIPDLSGPAPRPVRRNAVEPVAAESARAPRAGARTQVTNKAQGPVRASMQIRRLDPWSVLKVSLVLSVALFFVWMIAVAFLYLVLGGMGVWSKLNSNVGDLLTSSGGGGGELVSSGMIFGGALLIGLVNIVLLTAMATCGAFIYNLSTDIVGGIEVTLADRD
jgi:Transmembrane domain of unknown function (DUF3566)